jgi:hypothetical protein
MNAANRHSGGAETKQPRKRENKKLRTPGGDIAPRSAP